MTKLKQALKLQSGKTYMTNEGQTVTMTLHEDKYDYFYKFKGSNGIYYSTSGSIYEDAGTYDENISHEVLDCTNQPEVIDEFSFKQRTKDTKRKITFTDYSDGTINLKFKTKTKGQDVLIGGIRLSYEALDFLYEALSELKSQEERTFN
jgi:nanoRNase/pAp phosphatase (c-di-AMP/oligoRNAs hydrolase)